MLPAVPAIIGIVLLGKSSSHVRVVDVICLVIGGVTAFAVGVMQGRMLQLSAREGALWGKMPERGLWLWALLAVARLVMALAAAGIFPHSALS